MAAWQSPTVGLPLEVWHTGGVGSEHCASVKVACAIAIAIRARLNISTSCER